MTLDLGRVSVPDPDVAVIPGAPTPAGDYPTTALLVVEVSDTTLRHDRGRKARMYARAGIADYWIVNLVDGQVEVHREPLYNPAKRPRYQYTRITVVRPGDVLSPLAAPTGSIAVADLLP
jgi:Uma2 family endonuclease